MKIARIPLRNTGYRGWVFGYFGLLKTVLFSFSGTLSGGYFVCLDCPTGICFQVPFPELRYIHDPRHRRQVRASILLEGVLLHCVATILLLAGPAKRTSTPSLREPRGTQALARIHYSRGRPARKHPPSLPVDCSIPQFAISRFPVNLVVQHVAG